VVVLVETVGCDVYQALVNERMIEGRKYGRKEESKEGQKEDDNCERREKNKKRRKRSKKLLSLEGSLKK
jgi:hypothetical protein